MNTTICQSFSGTVNWGFLVLTIICFLEMFTICFVILINRIYKKKDFIEQEGKEGSDADNSAQNLTENESGKTFEPKN